jgi:hypothetical protein
LALAFGIPPRELARRLSARELAEYEALDRLDPFGPERGDLRMAILASLIANVNRDPKKTKAFKPLDFMPYVPEADKRAADQRDLQASILSALKPVKKRKAKR